MKGTLTSKRERFEFTWPGKKEAQAQVSRRCRAGLVPVNEESVRFETTANVFIEGDNLEALKCLLTSHRSQVKLIYIDPPYNTGQDLVYPDNYADPLRTYLRRTGQVDAAGNLLTGHPETEGRYHAAWLSMMYPRLFLARQLLREDGVMFVSIDDHEAHHLRMLMNEVFGEDNFLANIAWEKRYTRGNNAKLFYSVKDSILVYRKSAALTFLREPRTEKANAGYANPDNDPRGPWRTASYVNPATREQRPNLVYAITRPTTGERVEHPTHAWKYQRSEHQRHVREKRLWWGKDGSALYPRLKLFLSESQGGLVPIDLWDYRSSGTTHQGSAELKELFGSAVFDNPKPTLLMRRILRLATSAQESDLVLDFFAGSCTMAQALLELNREDGGRRRFLMVQLAEPTERNDFATIAEIGKERIRRVIGRLGQERAPAEDLGFKVFKLSAAPRRG